MSNRGSGLAIVAIIIAIGGVGMGLYTIFLQPATIIQQASGNSEITNIWTVEQASTFYPSGSYSPMPNMDVDITVNAGETVYVMFNALIMTTATTWLVGGVRITLDTVEISGSRREFNIETSNGLAANSITTHFIIEGLSGTYELEVEALAAAGGGTDSVTDGLLIVYTYR